MQDKSILTLIISATTLIPNKEHSEVLGGHSFWGSRIQPTMIITVSSDPALVSSAW